MNIQDEKATIAEYAAALNAANLDLISNLYTEDGIFMPENSRIIKKADLLKRSQRFFNNNQFKISYSIQDIVVNGSYAFVQATAQTNMVNPENSTAISKTSQDFFVLRKEQNNWKIFRYMFNNVKEQ